MPLRQQARQDHCENAGKKYAVEGFGPADRGYRCPETSGLIEIEKIDPYQGTHALRDIGNGGHVFLRYEERGKRGHYRCDECRLGNNTYPSRFFLIEGFVI